MRITTIAPTAVALVLLSATPMRAQAPAPARQPGPIVPSFGGVFDVPSPGLPAPKDQDLKLRFDVNVGPEAGELNAGFDTVARFLPHWHEVIAPAIRSGRRVLIAAHGNSLRALVKYLDEISETDIVELNIPTGIPLVYMLNDDLKPLRKFYLGDAEAAERAAAAVANQGRVRT